MLLIFCFSYYERRHTKSTFLFSNFNGNCFIIMKCQTMKKQFKFCFVLNTLELFVTKMCNFLVTSAVVLRL